MNTQLMTPDEVADHLRISPDTLANWRYLGKGPAYVRQGRIVRYHADALAAWFSTHEVSASA
ncbi:helix-turn-helix domain-containing protein [Brachybacterium tyrofermentans]|uniref:helix-turn-helix domain-containing protein n=1 Tax=Brachybacterium tyrofermentans TaxID=47848 RepID=UPI00299F912A|nr:helix-turn-helix domain-containing protein [Brachybacterium tyrofermentans]